jgi:hypothetical protein
MSQFTTAWYQAQLAKDVARHRVKCPWGTGIDIKCEPCNGTGKVDPEPKVYRKSEAGLHQQILDECRRRGWIALHGSMAAPTKRTEGEPDFVILADGGRVFLVECKTATGKLSTAQAALHAWTRKLGHTVHVIRSLEEFLSLCLTAPENT